jgi:hypothetical protein
MPPTGRPGLEDSEEPILLDDAGRPVSDRLSSGYSANRRTTAAGGPPPLPGKAQRPAAQGADSAHAAQQKPVRRRTAAPHSPASPKSPPPKAGEAGEDEFWNLSE